MKKPIELIWGLIMNNSHLDAEKYYNKVDPNWVRNTSEARIYQLIGELLAEKKRVDMLTLMLKFKDKGWVDKNTPSYLSRLSSAILDLNVVISVESIFEAAKMDYTFQMAETTRNKLSNLLESDNFSEDKYKAIIENAKLNEKKPSDAFCVNKEISTVFDRYEMARNGDLGGIEIGYNCLKQIVLLEPVDLMVIGARPAMGKTAFAVNTMIKMAKEGKKVILFALEMSTTQIMRRVLANIAEIDSQRIKYGTCTPNELYRLQHVKTVDFLKNITIYDGSQTVASLSSIIYQHKVSEGVDCVILDYLQKVIPKNSRSRYESISDISNGVKNICQNLKVPIIALAQLSRDSAKLAKRPSLPDIRESGEIEQDASIVGFLHRPEYYGETTTYNGMDSKNICEFIIAKNREGDLGIFDMQVDLKISKFDA